MIELSKTVAKIRLWYHANAVDINGVLNQLHIMSDAKCEESNRRHVMTVITDIAPRLGKDVSVFYEKEEEAE